MTRGRLNRNIIRSTELVNTDEDNYKFDMILPYMN